LSEFVYELPKNRMVPKCPVCGLSADDAENVKPHCGFTRICHCTWVKRVKTHCCCCFQGRLFNPTHLL